MHGERRIGSGKESDLEIGIGTGIETETENGPETESGTEITARLQVCSTGECNTFSVL